MVISRDNFIAGVMEEEDQDWLYADMVAETYRSYASHDNGQENWDLAWDMYMFDRGPY